MAMVFGSESFVRFCNLVEKCMPTIVDFWLYDSPESVYQYIVDENIVTRSDFSRFPNAIESGIPMSRSLCALWPGLVEVSHPLGVYYPLVVCQREADLHLLIHWSWYPYLREAESWCISAIHLPLLLWTRSVLVPPLFQAYYCRIVGLCDTFIVSKWIWQVICNVLQIFWTHGSDLWVRGFEAEMCWTFH